MIVIQKIDVIECIIGLVNAGCVFACVWYCMIASHRIVFLDSPQCRDCLAFNCLAKSYLVLLLGFTTWFYYLVFGKTNECIAVKSIFP